ncbi:MAG: peptidoglycan DD-metalloendopeptidase family protein [Oscillospiraceae bacterium]|jgi:murein DD-endopeptidase MepM/ murein hydrolase activator NlpD|nr:peptidoglycan DD-metalloendopeptidase family protein [Oscillospiraceae bacterium]
MKRNVKLRRKRGFTVVCIILALVFLLGLIVPVILNITAGAASLSDQLSSLKKQQNEIAEKQKDVRSQIKELSGQIAEVGSLKAALDQQIELTELEIINVGEQILVIEQEIAIKQQEYDLTYDDELHQVEIFKARVRAMEENGDISYYSILFQANSFADLLSRIDFISEIMSYDESVVDRLSAAKQSTADKKAELEAIKTEVESYRELQLQKIAEKEDEIAEAEALMLSLMEDKETLAALNKQYEADRAAVDAKITDTVKKLEEQRKAAEKAAGGSIVSTGQFIWPSDSTTITSGFGARASPTKGASTYHKGVDVGAKHGSNIYASDSGKVVIAEYSSSYGNYVMINHGDGRYTVYAHMSKISCKVGNSVTQGQVIGLVGSTGISTGPHLHFEIHTNGAAVNPMNYFK